jgi:hypothetical protein
MRHRLASVGMLSRHIFITFYNPFHDLLVMHVTQRLIWVFTFNPNWFILYLVFCCLRTGSLVQTERTTFFNYCPVTRTSSQTGPSSTSCFRFSIWLVSQATVKLDQAKSRVKHRYNTASLGSFLSQSFITLKIYFSKFFMNVRTLSFYCVDAVGGCVLFNNHLSHSEAINSILMNMCK